MLLNKREIQYIVNNIDLTDLEKKTIANGDNLSDDDLLLLHDKLTDRLDYVGFDGAYNITKEGKILETIIDKLYDILQDGKTVK
jgi:hypothetical protein